MEIRKSRSLSTRSVIVTIMLAMFSLATFAKKETYTSQYVPGSSIYVSDASPNFNQRIPSLTKRNTRLYFRIVSLPATINTKTFSRELRFKVNGSSTIESLIVTYNAESSYQDVIFYDCGSAENYSVEVVNSPSLGSGANDFKLEAYLEMNVECYYDFSSTTVPVLSSFTVDQLLGNVTIEWNPLTEAEMYDVEWAWIENPSSVSSLDQFTLATSVFKYNATRVSTTASQYSIPLIYEKGILLCRYRALGVADNDPTILATGDWNYHFVAGSSLAGCPTCHIMAAGHNENLNWQYTGQFSEEGKRKTSISYFDGSMRNRQTQVKLNSNNSTVVAETIYDFQGRPTVQVMPVPTSNAPMTYISKHTLNAAGTASYSYLDFDIDPTSGDVCDPVSGKVSTSYGASKYYSSSNANKSGFNKFIPDAEGYPFTQTEYTSDNTGRVSRQAGAGDAMRMGNGHETRFLYGKPTQQDLDALFGAEVGNFEHYKKNITIDQNGQSVVTYVDMQGKTIATALTGTPPTNLDILPNATPGKSTTEVIMNDNTNQELDNLKTPSSKTFNIATPVASPSSLGLSYEITPNQYVAICDETQTRVCYDCVLDVYLMITDNCQKNYFYETSGSTTIYKKVVNQKVLDDLRSNQYVNPQENPNIPKVDICTNKETDQLLPGTYTITKILKVNTEALEAYTNQYMESHKDCFKTLQKVEAEINDTYQAYGCEPGDCKSCKKAFETEKEIFMDECVKENATSNCTQLFEMYVKDRCQVYCTEEPTMCDMAFERMLSDMAPHGQYGEFETGTDDKIIASNDKYKLSIYNSSNLLPASMVYGKKTWKNPNFFNGTTLTGNAHYYNKDGSVAMAPVVVTCENGKCTSEPELVGYTVTEDTKSVEVIYLKNLDDFVSLWPSDNSWARSLVCYHPEYGGLAVCRNLEKSQAFDNDLTTMKYPEFKVKYPWALEDIVDNDPFFNNSLPDTWVISLIKNRLINDLNKYSVSVNDPSKWLSMKQAAYKLAKCPDADENSIPCNSNCLNGVDFSKYDALITNPTETQKEELWDRYRVFYASAKQMWVNRYTIYKSLSNNSYNACIGNKDYLNEISQDLFNKPKELTNYNEYEIAGYDWTTSFNWFYTTTEQHHLCQPCYHRTASLYEGKSKIFARQSSFDNGAFSSVCGDDNSGTSEPINTTPASCPESLQLMTEKFKLMSSVTLLNTCKECPIALGFSSLLRSIFVKAEGMQSSKDEIRLSCTPEGLPEYNDEVKEAIGSKTSNNIVYWKRLLYSNTPGNRTYTGKIYDKDNNVAFANITLKMADAYPVSNGTSYTDMTFNWSDVIELCCIEYLDVMSKSPILTPQEFNQYPGKRFRMDAWVQTSTMTQSTKIKLEGYTDKIIFNSCDVVDCKSIENLKNINMLINNMTTKVPKDGETDPTIFLLTIPSTTFSSNHYSHIYSILNSSFEGSSLFTAGSNNVVWNYSTTSTVVQNFPILTCTLQKTINGVDAGSLVFKLMLEAGYQTSDFEALDNVVYISTNNLQAVPDASGAIEPIDPTNNALFYSYARYTNDPASMNHKVFLHTPAIDILDCTEYGYKKELKK